MFSSHRHRAARVAAAFGFVFLAAGPLGAETRASISGQVINSVSLRPIAGATVLIEESGRASTTDSQGRFTLNAIDPGSYHLVVAAAEFVVQRVHVAVEQTAQVLDLRLDPEVHYSEVVSVSPEARSAFESYQPTTALAGQQLAQSVQGTLGATLDGQPGVAQRSFGPGPSRPVIRGLDGDRILILENGRRTGDLSSQSSDHGVQVNPAAATRIEVVRGPATLLYGANAIGGLVNVISNDVPRAPLRGVSGTVTFDGGTGMAEGGAAGDVAWGDGRFALRAGGSARRSGDVRTPLGTVENTQSRSGIGSVGGAWTTSRGFVGASYAYDDTKYGIPVVEDGNVQLTPRRHAIDLRAEQRELSGFVESFRTSLAVRRYRHDELEGADVGTRFRNNTTEFELLLNHRPFGRLKGTIGGWGLARAFSAAGEEALAPPVDQRGAAAFIFEELTWPHVTVQFGGRVDHTRFDPSAGLTPRRFTNVSGSTGVLLRPRDAITIAFSLARASRNPALEELYFLGPHAGNFEFEIGNPSLGSEHALGFDASVRWRAQRVSGEVTYFRNRIDDFIFRDPTGEVEDGFPVVNFVGADSVLQGVESHIDFQVTPGIAAEAGVDYVRGELAASGDPLPRIPPLRGRAGLRYQRNAFQAGGEVMAAADQGRVFGAETPTAGYATLKLFASWSVQTGRSLSTITARLDNATNELYRNHLSIIKDQVVEMGRNFRVVYSVKF